MKTIINKSGGILLILVLCAILVFALMPKLNNSQTNPKNSVVLLLESDSNEQSVSVDRRKNTVKNKRIAETSTIDPLVQKSSGRLTAYLASHQQAIVGIYGGRETDNPADNVLNVTIDQELQSNDRVWLKYNLTGVSDFNGVACSVNDRLAFGGYFIKCDSMMHRQRIQISPAWLNKGKNRIHFGLHAQANYGYKVTDLVIEVEKNAVESEDFVINANKTRYNGKVYLHGFVSDYKNADVKIEGKSLKLRDGEFEYQTTSDTLLNVTAKIGKRTFRRVLRFTKNVMPEISYTLNSNVKEEHATFKKNKSNFLNTDIAQLRAPSKVMLNTFQISSTNLRNIDLPALDMGMVNVTAEGRGVRFLPHGQHFKGDGATVSLKYDRTRIPDGYTENDIRTFYFDLNTNHWVALDRDTVDKKICMVVSKTTHFTDMINGVVKTPESPETQGFAPTMMNDIKAADPTAKIEMIAPPSANNQGSANLSYPIELLPAKNGIVPNLAITYNSDGGSGLLGDGWDMNIPVISVDTRWGVPRYDPKYETETYNLNGSMLAMAVNDAANQDTMGNVVVGHRGILYERLTGTVQFNKIVENDFSKIVRIGSNSGDYIWEITGKDGITQTYGEVSNNARVYGSTKSFQFYKHPYSSVETKNLVQKNVVSEWKLSSVKDQFGNFCRYIYTVDEQSIGTNTFSKEVVLSQILIGHTTNNVDTIYQKINLISDAWKTKKHNNARYGFFVSNNKLLKKIEIYLNENTPVRSYLFSYINGKFNKDLLDNVELLNVGSEAFKHKFEYFNNITNNAVLHNSTVNILNLGTTVNDLPALGGSKSFNDGGSLYIGLAAGIDFLDAKIDVGYNYSKSTSESDSKMMLVDINGDGLPDKVYKKEISNKDYFYFRPNIGNSTFGAEIRINIPGFITFSETESHSNGWKGVFNFLKAYKVNVGMDWSESTTNTKTYLSDVNNDGLIDVVNNGVVYFNTLGGFTDDGIAIPYFYTNSGSTPNPILNIKTPKKKGYLISTSDNLQVMPSAPLKIKAFRVGQPEDDVQIEPSPAPIQRSDSSILVEKRSLYEVSPMQDIVRVWEAPYTGEIEINSLIKYINPNLISGTTDGVRLTLQHRNEELWSMAIQSNDTVSKEIDHEIFSVDAGEKVFFRLQSGNDEFSDGIQDIVTWKPTITYIDRDVNTKDENDYSDAVFRSSEGSFVSKIGYNLVDSIDAGTPVIVKGLFVKPKTSNAVNLKVYMSNDSILTRDTIHVTINYNDTTGLNDTIYTNVVVPYVNPGYYPKTMIKSILFSADTICSGELEFQIQSLPGNTHYRFEITSSTNVNWDKISWSPVLYYKRNGLDTMFYAGVKYDVFTNKNQERKYIDFADKGLCPGNGGQYSSLNSGITPEVIFNTNRLINTDYTLELNSSDNLHYRRYDGQIVNSQIFNSSFVLDTMICGDVFFDIYINDTIDVSNVSAKVYLGNDTLNARVFCKRSIYNHDFGHMWRGWGQFEYNASDGRYNEPIHENKLYLPRDTSKYALKNEWGLKNMRLFTLNPDVYIKNRWTGLNDHLFMYGDTMCTGRLNIEEMPSILVHSNPGGPSRVPPAGPVSSPLISTNLNSSLYCFSNQPVLSTYYKSKSTWGGAGVEIGEYIEGLDFELGGSIAKSDGTSKVTSGL